MGADALPAACACAARLVLVSVSAKRLRLRRRVVGGARSFSTAIFFLVPRGSVSRLHRIRSAEVWHFYLGSPLVVYELDPSSGAEKRTTLGADVLAGQRLQHVVPAGAWFGSHLAADADAAAASASPAATPSDSRDYALVGCTVSPGFDFADFEMAKRDALLQQFPHAAADIVRLTDA